MSQDLVCYATKSSSKFLGGISTLLKRESVICSLNIRSYQIIILFKHVIAFAKQPHCFIKFVICPLNIRFHEIINLFKHLIAFATQPLSQDLVCCATESSSKFFGGISILLQRQKVSFVLKYPFLSNY